MWMIIGYGIQFISIFLLIGINTTLSHIARKLDRLVPDEEQAEESAEQP